MAQGIATPKAPNRAAPVSGVALTGKRKSLARVGSESMSDRKVNTNSSKNTSNLSAHRQSRSGS